MFFSDFFRWDAVPVALVALSLLQLWRVAINLRQYHSSSVHDKSKSMLSLFGLSLAGLFLGPGLSFGLIKVFASMGIKHRSQGGGLSSLGEAGLMLILIIAAGAISGVCEGVIIWLKIQLRKVKNDRQKSQNF